jgi:hypothetical protein
MTRWSLELEIDEIEHVDLSAVRARTLVAVGERDKADFHVIADRLVRELPGRRLCGDPGRRSPAAARAPRGDRGARRPLPEGQERHLGVP